jgi:tetratricopeptide (TPR) repeat protein
LIATAGVGLVVGLASTVHASNDDFDTLLRNSPTAWGQREILQRAQAAHPIDYFYALRYARFEPLKSTSGTQSPRLHALNRALRLCPSCDVVHVEIARNLWRLGLRRQALLEWRTAVSLQPETLRPVLGELFGAGAKPEELAAVAAFSGERMVEVASFLSSVSRIQDAFVVLDQADALAAPAPASLVMRGTLQYQSGRYDDASQTVAKARALNIRDPRLSVLEARLLIATKGAAAADEALAILDAAASRDPLDLAVQRERGDLVLRFEKWQAASRAVEGLGQALFRAQGSAGEAHTLSARIEARLGHWGQALSTYRVALADDRMNVSLWLEFGRAAERAGRDITAREAYGQANRLMPANQDIAKSLRAVEERLGKARGYETPAPSHP